MNTITCTCGARADITLEAHGHVTPVCIGCAEALSPLFDYTIRALVPMRAETAGRVFVTGSEIPEKMLSECYDVLAGTP